MSELEERISAYINDIHKSLDNGIYHGALTIALTLPDICSKLQYPDTNTGVRYPDWFASYVKDRYTSFIGPDTVKHVFLDENDAYALRCAFLHQGETNIEKQRARKVLTNFVFIPPLNGNFIHCNKSNSTLQLQKDIFCLDIISGVKQWLKDNKESEDINQRANNIMTISKEIRF